MFYLSCPYKEECRLSLFHFIAFFLLFLCQGMLAWLTSVSSSIKVWLAPKLNKHIYRNVLLMLPLILNGKYACGHVCMNVYINKWWSQSRTLTIYSPSHMLVTLSLSGSGYNCFSCNELFITAAEQMCNLLRVFSTLSLRRTIKRIRDSLTRKTRTHLSS